MKLVIIPYISLNFSYSIFADCIFMRFKLFYSKIFILASCIMLKLKTNNTTTTKLKQTKCVVQTTQVMKNMKIF